MTKALALKSCDMCAGDTSKLHFIAYGENITLCSGDCAAAILQAWAPTPRRIRAYRAARRQLRRMDRANAALCAASLLVYLAFYFV